MLKYSEFLIELIFWNLNALNRLIADDMDFHYPSHDHFSIKFHSLCVNSESHD